MERQYKTLLGAVLSTLLLLGTYLSDQNDVDSYHRNLQSKVISALPDPKSIALKPQDFQKTIGASNESGVSKPPIQIFYNLFVNGPENANRVLGIFHEQLLEMDPVLHDVAFVNSVGYLPPEISEQYIVGHHQEGGEDGALHALWDYCRANDNHETKVVYIHSKGSFHPRPENDRMRRFLTEGALSKECASLPDRCNVCSSRMSPHPHPHTSGNMWLARCDYVARLRDPYDLKDRKLPAVYQEARSQRRTSDCCWGYGRFFFEHWVHSHPSVQPCDLYPGMDYTWNYAHVPNINFEKNISMAPRFGFDVFVFGHSVRCNKDGNVVDLGSKATYLESVKIGYRLLYDIDVGGLNETWYLSQFVNPTSPL